MDQSAHNRQSPIYILLSIKTRIETYEVLQEKPNPGTIYILLSIKTRIETARWEGRSSDKTKFISYYPLKQGLKPHDILHDICRILAFISYYPLKQGLKLATIDPLIARTADLYPTIH